MLLLIECYIDGFISMVYDFGILCFSMEVLVSVWIWNFGVYFIMVFFIVKLLKVYFLFY